MSKLKNLIFISFSIILILTILKSCSSIEIKDVSVKIIPYSPVDKGAKFFEICINSEGWNNSDRPVIGFEIHSKEKRIENYSIELRKIEPPCKKYNVLQPFYFIHRHTPEEEYEWIKSLKAEDIDFIIITVSEDSKQVFKKVIKSEALK